MKYRVWPKGRGEKALIVEADGWMSAAHMAEGWRVVEVCEVEAYRRALEAGLPIPSATLVRALPTSEERIKNHE